MGQTKEYEEDVRLERDGRSMGLYVSQVWWEPVGDEDGVRHYPQAEVVINTDEQRPVSPEEWDEWGDDIRDHIREVLRHAD